MSFLFLAMVTRYHYPKIKDAIFTYFWHNIPTQIYTVQDHLVVFPKESLEKKVCKCESLIEHLRWKSWLGKIPL